MAKDGLDLGGTGSAEFFALRAGQVGTGLLAVSQQLETDADGAVALGFGTALSERTIGTTLTGIDAPVGDIIIVGRIRRGVLDVQPFVRRTDELIGFQNEGRIRSQVRVKSHLSQPGLLLSLAVPANRHAIHRSTAQPAQRLPPLPLEVGYNAPV